MLDPAETSGIVARRDGMCGWCSEPIVTWEHSIRKVTGRGWLHEKCADRAEGLEQVRADHGLVSEREEQQ